MNQTNQIDIWNYVEMALRRKWLIIIPFILITSLGLIYSQLPPDVYQASTLILVEPQKVPEAYIQSTVTSTVNERLRIIRQQIMSRTMLEPLIEQFNLYGKARVSLPMEDIISIMRENIEIIVQGADSRRGSLGSFQLFYQGNDPETVAIVTNRLASLFIEENLKSRERQAQGTTEFLEKELDRIRSELETRETAIKNFKEQHMGELPEQLDASLRALDRLQLQVQTNNEALRFAEDRKVALQRELAEIESVSIIGENSEGMVSTSESPGAQLSALKQRLLNLQARYTDKHPEVLRIERDISKLETELAKISDDEKNKITGSIDISSPDPRSRDLNIQLTERTLEIRRLKEENVKVGIEIKKYQQKVDNIPEHEQELMILTRDYENIMENYQSLLTRKLDSQLASNMERRQKGERFKILDPARIPQTPYKPDRRKIALLGLVLGLGLGGGLAFVTEYMDQSFRNSKDLEILAQLPVLASIPTIHTKREMNKKMIRRRIAYVSSLGILGFMITTAAIHFWFYRLDFLLTELGHVRKFLLP